MLLMSDMVHSKTDFSIVILVGLIAYGLPHGYAIATVVGTMLTYLVRKYPIGLTKFGINSLVLLAAAFALGGAYVGIEETVEDSLAAELLPGALRGTGFGTMAVVNGMGDFVSSVCVGWLWAAFGPATGFGFALILMSAGAGVVWATRNSTPNW